MLNKSLKLELLRISQMIASEQKKKKIQYFFLIRLPDYLV